MLFQPVWYFVSACLVLFSACLVLSFFSLSDKTQPPVKRRPPRTTVCTSESEAGSTDGWCLPKSSEGSPGVGSKEPRGARVASFKPKAYVLSYYKQHCETSLSSLPPLLLLQRLPLRLLPDKAQSAKAQSVLMIRSLH